MKDPHQQFVVSSVLYPYGYETSHCAHVDDGSWRSSYNP